MGRLGDTIPPSGRALTPRQVLQAITWTGDLDPDKILWAIRRAGEVDLAAKWPELSADEIARMRDLCSAMTRNRLRLWKRNGESREPTWLEIRALISGLHLIGE